MKAPNAPKGVWASPAQLEYLESIFGGAHGPVPTADECAGVRIRLGRLGGKEPTDVQVKAWFSNRRSREKKREDTVHNEANGDHRSGSQSKPPAIAASPSSGTDSGGVDETNNPPDGEAEGIITRKRPRATAAPAPAPATAATSVLARAVITAAAVASAQTRLNAIPGSKGYTARGAINFVSPDGTTFFSVDEVAEFICKGGGGGGGSGGSG
eukprot:CAMPEP_0181355524 /NCGR_PEP_ID=MMETSP1106-20121128/3947_1 /TAXON_ID=81844 /ORGANISM="Mantoniella antarctica, Strain SL-175" /LENGTH=211 /DNA_ID=CAMNT_0023468273 /DNA_START=115 /DNA_END=747 /DNA_ORIENTATION=+